MSVYGTHTSREIFKHNYKIYTRKFYTPEGWPKKKKNRRRKWRSRTKEKKQNLDEFLDYV